MSEATGSRHSFIVQNGTQEDIVRPTTLLDSPIQVSPRTWQDDDRAATVGTARPDTADFDRLVATMVPCRQYDPELWFAERTAEVERAKSLCRQCPLRQGCLEGAVERREPWGVWGGEVFVGGVVVPRKRGRGRPRKDESSAA